LFNRLLCIAGSRNSGNIMLLVVISNLIEHSWYGKRLKQSSSRQVFRAKTTIESFECVF